MKELEQVKEAWVRAFPLPGLRPFVDRSRRQERVWPRQVAMAVLRDQYGLTLTEIAEAFGVTHGTVHHAVKRVRDAVQTDSHAKWQVKRVLKCLVEVRR